MTDPASPPLDGDVAPDLRGLLRPIGTHWRRLVVLPVAAAALAYAATFLVQPVFIAQTTFLPPQSQQNSALGALASLGSLAGLGGLSNANKSPAEQFVALMQSVSVSDRMIRKFDLRKVYDDHWQDQARRDLAKRTGFLIGRKDGLISISVEDHDPKRAAAMANEYVEELRRMTSVLAITDAQQRRQFFERQMQETKDRLVAAQVALEQSGFTMGALKSEPRAAAESYANLRAQLTTQEVKLSALQQSLAGGAPEVQRQLATVQALRGQMAAIGENTPASGASADYVGKYREFKYQETLFEQLARQFELARVDEAREGALIQVIDPALVPERKSRPRRGLIAATAAGVALALGLAWVLLRERSRRAASRA